MLRFARRFGRLLILAAALPLLLWLGLGTIQSNRAFVSLNHLPSLFTTEGDAAVLATAEAQLAATLRHQPARASTRRMLALVQRAQGEVAPEPAGITASDLLWWGQQKQQVGNLDEARYLYRWATELEPGVSDGWYYLGRLYQGQEAWEAAGDSYRQALAAAHFSDASLEAAAHYGLGEVLLWNEADPAAAIPHYQAALAITPADHWARLRLGYALYWETGDVVAAETEILTAIDHWPDEQYLKWPYFYLGELYQDAGLTARAIAAYERVLALDPADEPVRGRLATLRSR